MDGKILAVGSAADVVDLGGNFAMPGMHDLHVHFEGFYNATMLEGKTLRYTGEETSIAELQDKLKEYAGKWGWSYFPELTREQHKNGMPKIIGLRASKMSNRTGS